METVVSSWGNSLGIRIPKTISDLCHLTDKSKVKIEASDDIIVITKIKEPKKHIPMSERMKLCKDWDGKPYELTTEDKMWDTMPPVGGEIF
jgi:antitoxin component of MazEF toxin-antitoxin module